jgi:hypothetical protein
MPIASAGLADSHLLVISPATTLAAMDRRAFIRSAALFSGAVAAPGLVAACSTNGKGTARPGELPTGTPSMVAVVASFELLAGQENNIAFGLMTLQNEPIEEAQPQVFVRSLETRQVAGGPFETTSIEDAGVPALYGTTLSSLEPGTYEFVVVDGDDFATQAVNVVSPEDAQAPATGEKAISVPTPTDAKPLEFAKVCTQEPACGMHATSLDQALTAKRPVMLLFATPAYCQTTVCAPAVSNVDKVRSEGEFGDVEWIHVEVYSDDQRTLGEPVEKWNLPSEPWLFGIGADGTIKERLDGPIVPQWVGEIASGLTA